MNVSWVVLSCVESSKTKSVTDWTDTLNVCRGTSEPVFRCSSKFLSPFSTRPAVSNCQDRPRGPWSTKGSHLAILIFLTSSQNANLLLLRWGVGTTCKVWFVPRTERETDPTTTYQTHPHMPKRQGERILIVVVGSPQCEQDPCAMTACLSHTYAIPTTDMQGMGVALKIWSRVLWRWSAPGPQTELDRKPWLWTLCLGMWSQNTPHAKGYPRERFPLFGEVKV